MQKSDNTIIWRVNDIPSSGGSVINGRATLFGINSAVINVTNGAPTFRTISHEIGHARYDLRHPDEDWIKDGLNGSVNNDIYNIMNSGPLYQTNPLESISDFRIRAIPTEGHILLLVEDLMMIFTFLFITGSIKHLPSMAERSHSLTSPPTLGIMTANTVSEPRSMMSEMHLLA